MQQFNPNPSAWGTTATRSEVQVDQGLRAFMLGVYNNMTIGLAISALVALGVNKLAVASGPAGAAGRIGSVFLTQFRPPPYTTPLMWGGGLAPPPFLFFFSFPMGPVWAGRPP